jgi:aryl-alcohol dehydrogenase-like predicted oxidoreductase
MTWLKPLGTTGMKVSALGLGTVKLGRNDGVKYPTNFSIPDDKAATALLDQASELGINLIDTAPAYGNSEQRLGPLLRGQRDRWLICSKVGEEFDNGQSRFDFTPEHTAFSVERSLKRLNTDVIDIVLVHSDGADLRIIDELGTLSALKDLKRRGLIRAYGMSTKTVQGGLAAIEAGCDVVMLTYNLVEREESAVLDACAKNNAGALIKKAFASGHLATSVTDPVQASMDLIFSHRATSAAIIGTISPEHLRSNVTAARKALEWETSHRF